METEILNAKITSTSITMADHGVLTFWVTVQGGGWGCSIGGYVIGNGYLDADDDFFKGFGAGLEAMMRIMDTVGVDKWEDLKGKYVRCVLNDGLGGTITKIGNITKDKWFDLKEFFAKVQQETDRKEKTVKKGNEPHEYAAESKPIGKVINKEICDEGLKVTISTEDMKEENKKLKKEIEAMKESLDRQKHYNDIWRQGWFECLKSLGYYLNS